MIWNGSGETGKWWREKLFCDIFNLCFAFPRVHR